MKTFLLLLLIVSWSVQCYYDDDKAYLTNKMEEFIRHEKIMKAAPEYIHAVLKKLIMYPRTSFMVQKTYNSNMKPQSSFAYNGSVEDFGNAVHHTMHNVDIFAEGIRDLSGVILKELETHFDEYGVSLFDGVIIAQRHANVIGIAKSQNVTVDWLQFSGRCIYIKYYEVKEKLSERVVKSRSLGDLVWSFIELLFICIITAILFFSCFLCLAWNGML